jgi:hypothetical protein
MSEHITTLQQARMAPATAPRRDVVMGFANLEGFELMQRAAKLLASSTLVPVDYRSVIERKDRYGTVTDSRDNPNALANAVVALNMAQRMNADPLMVMQNLYIVEGRPSWSSQWIIAAINGCGRFSPLQFHLKHLGKKKVEFTSFVWENKQRREVTSVVDVENIECVAWAVNSGVTIPQFTREELKEHGGVYECCKEFGIPLVESPRVTIEMAVQEGWYTKNGSKWKTMPEVMLRYRSASFFGKLYAPELLMGLTTVEEAQDMIIDASTAPDGSIYVNTEEMRQEEAARTEKRTAKKESKAANVEDVQDNAEPESESNPNQDIDQETGEVLKQPQQSQQQATDDQDDPFAGIPNNPPARQSRARRSVDVD